MILDVLLRQNLLALQPWCWATYARRVDMAVQYRTISHIGFLASLPLLCQPRGFLSSRFHGGALPLHPQCFALSLLGWGCFDTTLLLGILRPLWEHPLAFKLRLKADRIRIPRAELFVDGMVSLCKFSLSNAGRSVQGVTIQQSIALRAPYILS